MRALLCDSVGSLDALRLTETAMPSIGERDVLVRVRACGLNFPDVLMVEGKYQRKPPQPFSPGQEYSGVVDRVGREVSRFKAGDRVYGMLAYGGLAEWVAVDEGTLYSLPATIDFDIAAAYLYTYSTSLYALRNRGGLSAGDSLLVLGAGGGVGTAAVELGKALGARVVAAASSDAKLTLARRLGADQTILYPAQLNDAAQQKQLGAQLKAAAGEAGFDVICDPVGGPYTEPALRSIGWEGRHLIIGFAAGGIASIAMNLALLKSCQIVGVSWGGAKLRDSSIEAAMQRELEQLLIQGRIHPPIAATFELSAGVDALKMLAGRRAVGKIIVHC